MGISIHTMKAKAKAARMKPTDLSIPDLRAFLDLLEADLARRKQDLKYFLDVVALKAAFDIIKTVQQRHRRVSALINHHNKTKGI